MISKPLMAIFVIAAFTCLLSAGEHLKRSAPEVVIARGGQAELQIVTTPQAGSATVKAAQALAGYLCRISGGKFQVVTGDGNTGIAVGVQGDFPNIDCQPGFKTDEPGEMQGYEIKSHPRGIFVIGATPEAVGYAIFDLLRQFGYRRYFPMAEWEIVPTAAELKLAMHLREIPDYYSRRIWPGYGFWPEYRTGDTLEWNKVNRNGGYELNTGHVYDKFIRDNKTAFDRHPEYYGLVDGKRSSSKLCISNPELRQLFCDYAVQTFAREPARSSFSVDPSDGGGWCKCEKCEKAGTPSTRAVMLANAVAAAVRNKFAGKRIGMYAYNLHSPPPDIAVDRDVVVSLATSFIRGGWTLDGMIAGWRRRQAVLGIREYYDVWAWTCNLPGRSRASDLGYIGATVPKFYREGARYFTAEAADDWGSGGLGYYLAARLLWNVGEAHGIAALKTDFLQKCFGPAEEPMRRFYALLDGSMKQPMCEDLLGKMYRCLAEARKIAAGDEAIMKRLDSLALYTRYCELFFRFESAERKDMVERGNELLRFAASIKATRMVHTLAVARRANRLLPAAMKSEALTLPDWKAAAVLSRDEIGKLIATGIGANQLLDFTPVAFGTDLVAVSGGTGQKVPPRGTIGPRRRECQYYVWITKELKPITLAVTGGLIIQYRDRGNVRIKLENIGGASENGERESLVQEDSSVPPDGVVRNVVLQPKQPGLHRITINDGGDMTLVNWNVGTAVTLPVEQNKPEAFNGRFYCYVPKGTKKLGFYGDLSRGRLVRPDGKVAVKFQKFKGFMSVAVADGEDGKYWQLQDINGIIRLLTVPSLLALAPEELLLPREVAEKDFANNNQ